MILHSSFPDFVLFLYIHMSHADDSYDPKELATIKHKMGLLFPGDTDVEKKLYGALRQYNAFDKSGLNDLFHASLKHFSQDVTMKETVYKDLHEIIQADGKVDQSEAKSLDTLKRIIDLHAESNAS